MTPELIGIITVGVALGGLVLQQSSRIADIDRRLARVEGLLEGLCVSERLPKS